MNVISYIAVTSSRNDQLKIVPPLQLNFDANPCQLTKKTNSGSSSIGRGVNEAAWDGGRIEGKDRRDR
jgi:hypothetical protein